MKASAERIEKNKVAMEVEVDAERFQNAIEQAYKKLVKKVNVPGFRVGRAPRKVVENYIGKSTLHSEAAEIVIPDAYMEALEETGVEPIAQPEVELLQIEEGEPLKFKATVKVKPEVKLGQYKGLEIKKVSSEVSDEDVDQELENLRQKHAQLVNVEEGTVQEGDIVTIDFTGRIDGEEFEGGHAEDYSLEIGSGQFIPGFEDQLVGMAPGETGEITVTFPEDYQNEDFAGKEAQFTVTVKTIKRKELALMDDEFAKDVSEFDTLEELRNDTLNNLKQKAEERAKEQMRSEVVDKAVENAEVEIPEEMIETRVDEMLSDMERRLMSQGLSMDNYLQYTGYTLDKLKENFRPEAEKIEKSTLVLEAIANEEGLEVTDEDLEEKLKEMADQYNQDVEMIRQIIQQQNQMESFKNNILREKSVELLLSEANIIEQNEEESEESSEDTDTKEAAQE